MQFNDEIKILTEILFFGYIIIGGYLFDRNLIKKAKAKNKTLREYIRSSEGAKKQFLGVISFFPLFIIYSFIKEYPMDLTIFVTAIVGGFYGILYYALMREVKNRKK